MIWTLKFLCLSTLTLYWSMHCYLCCWLCNGLLNAALLQSCYCEDAKQFEGIMKFVLAFLYSWSNVFFYLFHFDGKCYHKTYWLWTQILGANFYENHSDLLLKEFQLSLWGFNSNIRLTEIFQINSCSWCLW